MLDGGAGGAGGATDGRGARAVGDALATVVALVLTGGGDVCVHAQAMCVCVCTDAARATHRATHEHTSAERCRLAAALAANVRVVGAAPDTITQRLNAPPMSSISALR